MARKITTTVCHVNLILKHLKGRIGIWDLKTEDWHIKPWTKDLLTAYSMLSTARIVRSRKGAA